MLRTPTLSLFNMISLALSNGTAVEAIAGTPLSTLVNSSVPYEVYGVMSGDNATNILDGTLGTILNGAVSSSTQRTHEIDAMSQHTADMQICVDLASQVITRNLLLSRTIVNPKILELTEALQAELKFTIADAVKVNIVPYGLSGIWKSDILGSLVSTYATSNYKEAKDLPIHPKWGEFDIKELLESGSTRFDTRVAEWVSQGGITALEKVWTDHFAKEYPDMPETRAYNSITAGTIRDGNDYNLAIFIIANALKNKRPFEVALTDSDYNMRLEQIMYFIGGTIANIVKEHDASVASGRMIISYPGLNIDQNDGTTNIIVNGDIYHSWLDAGGTPEVILGSYITDRNVDATALADKAVTYLDAWNRYIGSKRSSQESNKLATVKKTLLRLGSDLIEGIEEDGGTATSEMYKLLTTKIASLNLYHLQDLHSVARDVICDTLYPNTMVKTILQLIDKYGQDNPQMEPRELALLATADIAVKYVTDMLNVTRTR